MSFLIIRSSFPYLVSQLWSKGLRTVPANTHKLTEVHRGSRRARATVSWSNECGEMWRLGFPLDIGVLGKEDFFRKFKSRLWSGREPPMVLSGPTEGIENKKELWVLPSGRYRGGRNKFPLTIFPGFQHCFSVSGTVFLFLLPFHIDTYKTRILAEEAQWPHFLEANIPQ